MLIRIRRKWDCDLGNINGLVERMDKVRGLKAQRWDRILKRHSCPHCGLEITLEMIGKWESKYDIRHWEPVHCPKCGWGLSFFSWEPEEKNGDRSGKFSTVGYAMGLYDLKMTAESSSSEYTIYSDRKLLNDYQEISRQVARRIPTKRPRR